MATQPHDNDEDDPDDLDREAPDESDMSDEPAEMICPFCKWEIPEESDRCPRCGSYLTPGIVPKRREWWWIAAVVLLVLLILSYLLKFG